MTTIPAPPGLLGVKLEFEKHLRASGIAIHCQDLEKKWQYASVRVQSKIISRANHHRDFPGTLWVGPSIAHRMQTPGALNNSKPWERKPRQEKLRICYSFEVSWLSLIPRLFRTNSSFVILFLMPPVDWRDMLLPCQCILRKGLDCEDRSEAWWERRRAPVSRAQSASTCDDKVSDYGGQKQTKRINKQYSNACVCLCLHQILSRWFHFLCRHGTNAQSALAKRSGLSLQYFSANFSIMRSIFWA